MQSTDGLVGVVIPVYAYTHKRVQYLRECLKSLERQEHPFTAVVVDDESPRRDEVASLVDLFDNRFKFIPRKRNPSDLGTASNSINLGIDLLVSHDGSVLESGEALKAVCYLHSDDMFPVGSLSNRYSVLRADSPFAYGQMILIDKDSKVIGMKGGERKLALGAHSFPHHSSMWDIDFMRDLLGYVHGKYDHQGLFDPQICYGENRDVTLSTFELLKLQGKGLSFVKPAPYYYRVHEASITGQTVEHHRARDGRHINHKHGVSGLHQAFNRISSDLPWSLGTHLPEPFKKELRPVRDFFKSSVSGNPSLHISDPLIAQ